ncbi:signal peptidase I [Brucepastera parasyntrophica]|uniref:signal peptidase I n=1 Tax=Brucepastera parasyntrophica TaxID=2880008 RepID=UPI0021091361|nr:signal peptidase I [Brucepastera parasyntrophica]ULQ59999.1 signal peptidase I [Brucepastera parasyntrophica]
MVISSTYSADTLLITRLANFLVSFVTFQRISPFSNNNWGEMPTVRRLVGFPGDSLYMNDFILYIKPAGAAHYLTEFEITEKEYDIKQERLPDEWTDALPFASSFPEITLQENEYFVLCDNRITASDSRIWGAIPSHRIQGKVLFRYWPPQRFGVP